MKLLNKILTLAFLSLALISCSSDDNNNIISTGNESTYAMTAKINGVLHEMNNPFNTNEATSSIWSYYPNDEYIQLTGRYGGVVGNPEISLWIKRTDLVIGTYNVGVDTNGTSTHIDIIDNSNFEADNSPIYEDTTSGSITITAIDTQTKIIQGTFEFMARKDSSINSELVHDITEGTFNYRYDVE